MRYLMRHTFFIYIFFSLTSVSVARAQEIDGKTQSRFLSGCERILAVIHTPRILQSAVWRGQDQRYIVFRLGDGLYDSKLHKIEGGKRSKTFLLTATTFRVFGGAGTCAKGNFIVLHRNGKLVGFFIVTRTFEETRVIDAVYQQKLEVIEITEDLGPLLKADNPYLQKTATLIARNLALVAEKALHNRRSERTDVEALLDIAFPL